MDGDLQDRPEDIPRLLAEYERGYDVVYARRVRRKESLPRRTAFYVFYRLMRRLSEIEVPVDSGDFALMSRRVVDQINQLPERHRYIRGLRTWVASSRPESRSNVKPGPVARPFRCESSSGSRSTGSSLSP